MSETQLLGVAEFVLVTPDLNALSSFYRDVLGFAPSGGEASVARAELALLGLGGAGRRQRLTLGRQKLAIEQFDPPGHPYPTDGNAASRWFQHFALVVVDMATAWERLHACVPISDGGPQRLPGGAGGVTAFKFRDPDGHPLELLQFPVEHTPDAWRGRPLAGQIGLGIDHSAISVADIAASVGFYRSLGLVEGGRTLNQGPAQQRLDALTGVVVDVVPLRPPDAPPHLELLGYRTPQPAGGLMVRPNDVAASRIVWSAGVARLLSDPDGHLMQLCP